MNMLLLLLVLFPVLAGVATLVSGRAAKYTALLGAVVQLGATLLLVSDAETLSLTLPWVDETLFFALQADGLGKLMVLLTSILLPLIIWSAYGREWKKEPTYYALMLFMQAGLTGVFLAAGAFTFYFFWEAALIPVYFMAAIWGPGFRSNTFLKFFIYTVLGSFFMLVAFIFIYTQANNDSLPAIYAAASNMAIENQRWIFWALFIAFAIKMPVFPFHTWQPDTYTEAPPQATMLLSGIMLKMGIYGVIRWLLPVVPLGVEAYGNIAMILAVIGIIYGSVIAIMQRDMKRLAAYSSFAHVGLMAAGIFSGSLNGLEGAAIQMIAHGVNVVGLFYVIDIIEQRTGTREIARLGGITQKAPALTVYFMILLLGSVALPLTSGFPGEFLLLLSVFDYNTTMGVIAGFTIILGAIYMLRMYQGVMFGPQSKNTEEAQLTIGGSPALVLFVLCVLVLWIGLHPATFMNLPSLALQLIATK